MNRVTLRQPTSRTGETPTLAPLRRFEKTARSGTLLRQSFAELLATIFTRSLSGTVVLHAADGGTHAVYFVAGVPAKAQLWSSAAPLGEELARWGLVDRHEIQVHVEGARRLGVRLGEYLVGCREVPRHALEGALRAQVVERVAKLADLAPNTMFAIYPGIDFTSEAGGGELWPAEPLDALLATMRAMTNRDLVRAIARRVEGQRLILRELECTTFATPCEAVVLLAIERDEATIDALLERIKSPEDVYNVVATCVLGRNLIEPMTSCERAQSGFTTRFTKSARLGGWIAETPGF